MSVDLAAYAVRVQSLLGQSPLRSGRSIPPFWGLEELARLEREIAALSQRLQNRLSMVVMGEVKAGKSTLINALAGSPVSPTNVLESTAAIIEIEYADVEEATLERHDGSKSHGGVQEIYHLLERHRADEQFFSQCKVVRLGFPLPRLKRLRIVDTPGLATITGRNAAVAREYIRHADLVLWVLNGLHLGQSDVVKEMADVARLGKPIIAVINRVDQVETAPSRLISYVQRELGIYVQHVFALSAKRGFDAVMENDPELRDASGLSELIEYLESEINARHAQVKIEAVYSSLLSILLREQSLHESAQRQLSQFRDKIAEHHRTVTLNSNQIEQRLVSWIRSEVDRDLLAAEFAAIRADSNPSPEKIDQLLSSEKIRSWWEKKAQELQERFAQEWSDASRAFAESLRLDIEAFLNKESVRLAQEAAGTNPNVVDDALDGAAKGTLAGSAAGLGLAAYAAWLGPYAAYVGIGSAAMSLVPPLAVVGAIGGVAYGLFGRFHKKREREREVLMAVREHVREIRDAFKTEVIEAHVVPQIASSTRQAAGALHDAYARQLTHGLSPDALDQLQRELQDHVDAVGLVHLELTSRASDMVSYDHGGV